MTDPIPAEAYQALVEESLVGVYLIQDGRLLYVNRKLAGLFGYSREEMMALPSLLDVIAEPDREMVQERLRQRIAGEIREIEYNVQGIRKDGQIIHLDVRSARTLHEGRPAVMGSMVDITARKQLEDSMSAGMARLDPNRCTNVEALLVEADRELYQQKHLRRARREHYP
jgi:PAS domain S-box-containing protein